MRVGTIEILPVFDGTGREIADNILNRPGIDDPWGCHPDVLDENGHLHFEIGGFLIRSGDRVMLVDAGVGTVKDKTLEHGGVYTGGGFLDSLRNHGVAPEDVTDVLFTHLHFDHVGWGTQQGRIVFPNATYRVHEDDWNYFVEADDAHAGAVKKLSPLRNQLELFSESQNLAPGLDAIHSPGHTPGTTIYVASSGKQRALLLGDAVHSTVELAERDWEALFDVDPKAASAVRNAIADEILDTEDLVVGAHFPEMKFGRVLTVEGERRFIA